MHELDIQKRILMQLETEEYFNQLDDNELPNGFTPSRPQTHQ